MRSRIQVIRAGLLLSAAVAVIGACSFWDGLVGEGDNALQPRYATGVGVVVENHHWSDMVTYVVSSGRSRRLGMVTTGSREEFEISRNLLGTTVYLRAEAIGSSASIRTDVLSVGEGDVVIWTLQNQLGLSDYVIR